MKCCTCHAKSSSKTEDLMLQNATPLRKSAPGPPNISDEHVSCTAPATESASLQILFKCPTPAHVFLTSDHVHNPLRLPRKTTSERQKVLRTRQFFFALLTSKCDSRHNSAHFFDMSTSKSGPRMVFFVHFDLDMCFAPQRRALIRHVTFQKRSDTGVLRTFWLGNVLRATTAHTFFDIATPKSGPTLTYISFWLQNVLRATTVRTFSTSQLPGVVRHWGVLYILASKCASRHDGVQFFISLPRCSPDGSAPAALPRPLFDPLEPQIIGKTEHSVSFRDFPTFSRTWIFFLLTFSSLIFFFLLSLLWLFPTLLFICPYCRKLDF